MSEVTAPTTPEDRTLFSLHLEDDMTERRFHARQVSTFEHAFTTVHPDLFVARNMAVYWVPGQREHPYAGPDLFVSRQHPREENPSCYLTYEDGPIAFVVEVASDKTRAGEPKKRDETYAEALQIPEYLYVDWERHALELWRLTEGAYERVAPDRQGRLWSRELGVGFTWQEDGRLVRVVTPDGAMVPTPQEETALRLAAEARRERDARRAEREARRAKEAAARAEEEARRRADAEEQARTLAEEVERLRRALQDREHGA
jgi:Uma2 family endonuclease